MWLSVFVVLYVILMAAWWGHYGFFSAFLHLIVTIIAGTLALALWEPITLGLLMGMFHPEYAWPVGLLAPFAIFLLVFRFAADRLVRGNLDLHVLTNVLAGGVCGLFAGVLTSGLLVFGLSFMPDGLSGIGYVPVVLNDEGRLIDNNKLVPPVDKMALGFFSTLTGGAFYGGHPMDLYHNDPRGQAQRFEFRIDTNQETAIGATPGSVSVTGLHTAVGDDKKPLTASETVLAHLGKELQEPGKELVIVSTQWERASGVFNTDNILLNPAQLALVTWDNLKNPREAKQYPAAGVVVVTAAGGDQQSRTFYPFDNNKIAMAKGVGDKATFDFAFIIDQNQFPAQLLARHLRIDLTGLSARPTDPALALGSVPKEAEVKVVPVQASDLEVTALLPYPISKNMGNLLTYDANTPRLVDGNQEVQRTQGPMSNETRVMEVYAGPDNVIVRIKMTPDQATSLFGRAIQVGGALSPIYIKYNDDGEPHNAIGWVLLRGRDSAQVIHINRNDVQRNDNAKALDIPIAQINPDDALYLYFSVPAGAKITAYRVAGKDEIKLDQPIEAKKQP